MSQSHHACLTIEAPFPLAKMASRREVPGPLMSGLTPPAAFEKVDPSRPWSFITSKRRPSAIVAAMAGDVDGSLFTSPTRKYGIFAKEAARKEANRHRASLARFKSAHPSSPEWP